MTSGQLEEDTVRVQELGPVIRSKVLVLRFSGEKEAESNPLGSEHQPRRLGFMSCQANSQRWLLGRSLLRSKCYPCLVLETAYGTMYGEERSC